MGAVGVRRWCRVMGNLVDSGDSLGIHIIRSQPWLGVRVGTHFSVLACTHVEGYGFSELDTSLELASRLPSAGGPDICAVGVGDAVRGQGTEFLCASSYISRDGGAKMHGVRRSMCEATEVGGRTPILPPLVDESNAGKVVPNDTNFMRFVW